jgi:hypothetical protein
VQLKNKTTNLLMSEFTLACKAAERQEVLKETAEVWIDILRRALRKWKYFLLRLCAQP